MKFYEKIIGINVDNPAATPAHTLTFNDSGFVFNKDIVTLNSIKAQNNVEAGLSLKGFALEMKNQGGGDGLQLLLDGTNIWKWVGPNVADFLKWEMHAQPVWTFGNLTSLNNIYTLNVVNSISTSNLSANTITPSDLAKSIGDSSNKWTDIYTTNLNTTNLNSGIRWKDNVVTSPTYEIPGVNQSINETRGNLQIVTGQETQVQTTRIFYGKVTTSNSNVDTTVNFGLTFDQAPFVVITPQESIGGISYHIYSKSTTSFVIRLGSAVAKTFNWIAIGR